MRPIRFFRLSFFFFFLLLKFWEGRRLLKRRYAKISARYASASLVLFLLIQSANNNHISPLPERLLSRQHWVLGSAMQALQQCHWRELLQAEPRSDAYEENVNCFQTFRALLVGLFLLANELHPMSLIYAPDARILLIGQWKPTARPHLCVRQILGSGRGA